MSADIGLIGLAVMGQNLVLNMADHGFVVSVYNRTTAKVDEFLQGAASGKSIIGAHDIKTFISQLKRPRKIMLMIKAGTAVDEFIDQLLPHLEMGDILIDGGNSYYIDSERRYKSLKERHIHFIGTGISGGEEGARHGPSIMPGGSKEAWPQIRPIFQAIAARSTDGSICCEWVGSGGAGHYVKMVHNGIEYGDMQLISEAFDLMHRGVKISCEELSSIFHQWNLGRLNSYLIEITADILKVRDSDETALVSKILDVAGQKGTGKWTVSSALDLGVPVTLIGEAVFARCLSALKQERIEASRVFSISEPRFNGDKEDFYREVSNALYASKIISYAQGFLLMRQASEEYRWDLDFGSIALMWRGGCIIRSRFLGHIKEAFDRDKSLKNLLLDPFFVSELLGCHEAWRSVVARGVLLGIPMGCMSAGLHYFDGYRSETLPANLLQAQRDYFGAHMYERVDRPRGEFFHTNWTGRGGNVSSSQYGV